MVAKPSLDLPQTARSTTSVYLGDLKERVAALSAAAGVGPSTWVRSLVQRELEQPVPEASDVDARASASSIGSPVYRAWLDADLAAQLDARCKRDGFRSKAAALRALIEGVGVSVPTGEQAANAPSLREAVDALGESNYQLAGIARNIEAIAQSLRARPGVSVAVELESLERDRRALREYLDGAARLVGQLRPLLRRSVDPE